MRDVAWCDFGGGVWRGHKGGQCTHPLEVGEIRPVRKRKGSEPVRGTHDGDHAAVVYCCERAKEHRRDALAVAPEVMG